MRAAATGHAAVTGVEIEEEIEADAVDGRVVEVVVADAVVVPEAVVEGDGTGVTVVVAAAEAGIKSFRRYSSSVTLAFGGNFEGLHKCAVPFYLELFSRERERNARYRALRPRELGSSWLQHPVYSTIKHSRQGG